MARYVADTERILALVDRATSVGSRFEERIAEIEREVSNLGVDWEGGSAAAHRAKHEVLHRELGDMRDALAKLSALAHEARYRYLTNVENNKRMWP